MSRFKKTFLGIFTLCLMMLPSFFAFAGGSTNVVFVSDTRKLTGLMHWWGSCYNHSHLEFTIITIVLIPLVGCIFGLLADLFMNWVGIDLTKREAAEH